MAVATQMREWDRPTRRKAARFRMREPMNVTVLRSGIPDTVPGRSVNVCERGVAAIMAGEMVPGEAVAVELWLSPTTEPLKTRATVKYHHRLRCGLEFLSLSREQQAAIQRWTAEQAAAPESLDDRRVADLAKIPGNEFASQKEPESSGKKDGQEGGPPRPPRGRRKWGWIAALAFVLIAAGLWWWKWNRDWQEIEAGLNTQSASTETKPTAQVPAEVMQRLIQHRVEPVYPAEARRENLNGVIALDVIVGRDGTVQSVKALNGPEILARAAEDALRWWKFEPYKVNGEPAAVETTVAVEFKR